MYCLSVLSIIHLHSFGEATRSFMHLLVSSFQSVVYNCNSVYVHPGFPVNAFALTITFRPSRLLIDGTNGVVDKIWGQQDAERQDLHVTAGTSLCWAQTLRINEDAVVVRSQLYWLAPDPKTLGARIHARANLKAILQTQQPIQKEGLSSSIQAGNAHHCQSSRNLIQDRHGILLQMALPILTGSKKSGSPSTTKALISELTWKIMENQNKTRIYSETGDAVW